MAMSSSPDQPQPLREVAQALRGWVARLGWVWVEGQVIELNRRRNLNFLTLRDTLAEVSVSVSAETVVLDQAGPLTEGTTVTCELRPVVWTKTGRLSFVCREIRPSGEGRLLAAIEHRKRLLQAEGLFDQRLKKSLPPVPRSIGLITAANSAAERDVLTNVANRWPAVHFTVRHATMQGPRTVDEITAALAALDRDPAVEVIIIARGGGSLEDLLPYSDETLARAVFGARTPVVSAIGHETDTPILDLVADVRASTPTGAAKLVVPDMAAEITQVDRARTRLRQAVLSYLNREQQSLTNLRSRPALTNPLHSFDLRHAEVEALRHRVERAIDTRLASESSTLSHQLARVRSLSPRATLARGYAIVADGAGAEVTSVEEVNADDRLRILLADGELGVAVHDITHSARSRQDRSPDSEEQP